MKLSKTFFTMDKININGDSLIKEYLNSKERDNFWESILESTQKIAELFDNYSKENIKNETLDEAAMKNIQLGLQTQSVLLNDALELIVISAESFSYYVEQSYDSQETLRIIFLMQALSIGYVIITRLLDKTFLRYPTLEAELLSKELSPKMQDILSRLHNSKEILDVAKIFYKMKENIEEEKTYEAK